jgi:hypothetical protein
VLKKAAKAILKDDIAKGRASDPWGWSDQAWLTDNARAALDAAAPLIAAKALRDFAEWAETSDFAEYPFDGLDDTVRTIRDRADEIERGE